MSKQILSSILVVSCVARLAIAVPQGEDRESEALQEELRRQQRTSAAEDTSPERLAAARVGQEDESEAKSDAGTVGELMVESEVDGNRLLSKEDRRKVGLAGGRLLLHVQQAKEEIRKGDEKAGLEQVDKAIVLSKIIEQNVPTYELSTKIRSGELAYDDRSIVTAPLVPVYTELMQSVVLEPIVIAKREGQIALAQNEVEQSFEAGQRSTAPVRDAEMLASTIYLDIANVRPHLEDARSQLASNDSHGASRLLTAVQQGVVLSHAEVDMPVVKARDSLARARVLAKQGRISDAQQALNLSANALAKYENQAGQGSEDVSEVRKEIIRAAQSLREGDGSLAARIDDWSQRMSEWTEIG